MKRGKSLLRERDVGLVVASVGVSTLGDWLALIPLMLQVERMSDTPLAISALLICLWAPVAVLAGHVGILVDRFETTRLLVVVSLGQAAVALALAAFIESVAAVLALAVLLGCGIAISQAAEFALVPIVARGRAKEANGLVETARYTGFALGPLSGGLVAAAAGVGLAMVLNAATFVLVALAALALEVRRPPVRAEAGDVTPRARDGVVSLFRDRTLRLAMGVAFVSLLFMSASIPADVIYVEDVLGLDDWALGAVYTIWTVGMILGANVLARRVATGALAAAALAAVAAQGLGKALAPLWLAFGFMLACYFVGGVGHGLKNVAFRTLIHEQVPAGAHGRAFAAYNGLRNSAELGALAAGGVLVALLGARGTLWIAGGVSALAGVAGFALLRRTRSAPEAAAAATPSH